MMMMLTMMVSYSRAQVLCCEGQGLGEVVGDSVLPPGSPNHCGTNSSVWTMKAGKTGDTTCAVGESCHADVCARKSCTSTTNLLTTCPWFRYQGCTPMPDSVRDMYCKATGNTNTNNNNNGGSRSSQWWRGVVWISGMQFFIARAAAGVSPQ